MRKRRAVWTGVSVAIVMCCLFASRPARAAQSSRAPVAPPIAPVRPVTDTYFGTDLVDPYRYLETLTDPVVQAWMRQQDGYARAVLARLPGREALLHRIRAVEEAAPARVWGVVPLLDGSCLYLKRHPGEAVARLYRRDVSGAETLVADPARIPLAPAVRRKGRAGIHGFAVSPDGKYIAIGIVAGGDTVNGELHVLEVATGKEIGDVIPRIGAEAWWPSWLPDSKAIVYGRLQPLTAGAPATALRQNFRAYLHVLGTAPDLDRPVFGQGVGSLLLNPRDLAFVRVAPGSRYAVGVVGGGEFSAFYLAPVEALSTSSPSWRPVAGFADRVASVVVHDDDLYVLTAQDAPRARILRTDARQPNLAAAEILLPESPAVILGMQAAQDALYVSLLDAGVMRVQRVPYGAHPLPEEVRLPVQGTAHVGTDPRLPGAFLYLSAWTEAERIWRYDPVNRQVIDTHLEPLGPNDRPTAIASREVQVVSHDGTRVPLSIVFPTGMAPDGSHPTLLVGYGAYGASLRPAFEVARLAWHEQGGIYAVCHVRGGGEFGQEWHLAGKGPTKPNTWRDFIACAEYLTREGYTSSARLAGFGRSAGGILIGRALTERPNLFAAVLDTAGMSDMLRYVQTANGTVDSPEFGTVTTASGVETLLAMSAYHHVVDGTAYPAILLQTGSNDSVVEPSQMAKLAARLQAATISRKPVLLRVEYGSGHPAPSAGSAYEQRLADEWSFLLWQFGVPGFQL